MTKGPCNLGKAVKLTIQGTLPGLNEYINAERRNKYLAAKIKNQSEHVVMSYARRQLHGVHFSGPVTMTYTWYEPSRRRDKDNVSSYGRKVIQDALVKAGVLAGDGWRHIEGFRDRFVVDRDNPRIEVELEEAER